MSKGSSAARQRDRREFFIYIQECCKEVVVPFREIVRERLTEDDILALIAIAEQAREVVYKNVPLDDLLEKVEAFELRPGLWQEVES